MHPMRKDFSRLFFFWGGGSSNTFSGPAHLQKKKSHQFFLDCDRKPLSPKCSFEVPKFPEVDGAMPWILKFLGPKTSRKTVPVPGVQPGLLWCFGRESVAMGLGLWLGR